MQAAQALYEVTVQLADELPYRPTSLSSPVFVALCPVQEVSAMLHRDLAETFSMKSSKSVTVVVQLSPVITFSVDHDSWLMFVLKADCYRRT